MAEPCETVLRNEELLYSHTEPTAATKMRRASMRRAMMSTPLASLSLMWLRCRGDVKHEAALLAEKATRIVALASFGNDQKV